MRRFRPFTPLLTLAAIGWLGTSCAPRPLYDFDLVPHHGMPGPEDVVLDGPDRLLISSQDRRTEPRTPGEIFALDMPTAAVAVLPRRGEPDGLVLHPHGMDLVHRTDGQAWLYVITHHGEDATPPHGVAVYRVHHDHLAFLELLADPLLTSPNDLAALPDGQLYVGNDRSTLPGTSEMLLGLKRATVAHYDGHGAWKVVADQLAYCNGMAVVGSRLIVATTRENAIYGFAILGDGWLTHKTRLARVPAPDNFFVTGDDLFVAVHPRQDAFVAHALNPKRRSPSHVYRLDLATNELELLFADNGSGISGSSVALCLDQTLWIGQVFEPFLIEARVRTPAR